MSGSTSVPSGRDDLRQRVRASAHTQTHTYTHT